MVCPPAPNRPVTLDRASMLCARGNIDRVVALVHLVDDLAFIVRAIRATNPTVPVRAHVRLARRGILVAVPEGALARVLAMLAIHARRDRVLVARDARRLACGRSPA